MDSPIVMRQVKPGVLIDDTTGAYYFAPWLLFDYASAKRVVDYATSVDSGAPTPEWAKEVP